MFKGQSSVGIKHHLNNHFAFLARPHPTRGLGPGRLWQAGSYRLIYDECEKQTGAVLPVPIS